MPLRSSARRLGAVRRDTGIAQGDHRRCRRARRRVDRDRVAGRQRPLRRRPHHAQPCACRHRQPRLRVQPRRPEPAQPAHQRDRHPRRRHRAVQRRTAEGRGEGAPRLRLRPRRLRRRPAQRRGLGTPLHVPAEWHAHGWHDPRHADGRRCRVEPARRRRRPARGWVAAPDDRRPELRRCRGRHRTPHRTRGTRRRH